MNSATQPTLGLSHIFLKNVSLEMPTGAWALEQPLAPPSFELRLTSRYLKDDFYEVCVCATLTTHHDGKVVHLMEVEQAGVFQVQGVSSKNILENILEVECPALLQPHLSAALLDLQRLASVPLIPLPAINWQQERIKALGA